MNKNVNQNIHKNKNKIGKNKRKLKLHENCKYFTLHEKSKLKIIFIGIPNNFILFSCMKKFASTGNKSRISTYVTVRSFCFQYIIFIS